MRYMKDSRFLPSQRSGLVLACACCVLLSAASSLAGTNYVDAASATPVPPYSSWQTAATNIQNAIDVTVDGDVVLVTNGVYDTGGVVVHGSMTNRIAVTNAVTVRSVNGPDSTFLVGNGPLGDTAVRCAYVGTDAHLEGFKLTNGHTRTSGDSGTERSGGGAWSESIAVVSNCTVTGNSAANGGGTYGGTVQNCTISANSATSNGGGTYEGVVQNCAITGNIANDAGGGTFGGALQNCAIIGNSAYIGGGTDQGMVQNCTITGNSAVYGGGTHGSTVQNCVVYYNTANGGGENYHYGDFEFTCTIPDPGGVGNITNTPGLVGLSNPHIVWNSPCVDAGTNQDWMAAAVDIDGELRLDNGTVDMGCDEVHAGGLTGVLALAILADYTNVAAGFSIGFEAEIQGRPAGYRWLWGDGGSETNNPRASYAYNAPGDYNVVLQAWNLDGNASAMLAVHVAAGYTNYVSPTGSHVVPYETWASAATNIQAAISAQTVAGGVVLVTNGIYDTGGVVAHDSMTNRVAITKAVTVRSISGPERTYIIGRGPEGDAAVRCAYVGDRAQLEGFTLTNGYGFVDGDSSRGGGVWCEVTGVVSNCVITGNLATDGGGAYGGTVQNCTIIGNSAAYGGGTYMCKVRNCLIGGNSAGYGGGGTSGGTAENCTITGNLATDGGGAYGGTVQNCTITGNSASRNGGGAYGSTVQNCAINGNSSAYGGGTYLSRVSSCTITGNSAAHGGGTYEGLIQNCIVYYNSATDVGENSYNSFTYYTCTTPDPNGMGNITNDPRFVDANDSDFRLLSTSPCIDAGWNLDWMIGAIDLDGLPRIINGTVDMGAYESPSAIITSIIPLPSADEVVITWSSFSNAHYAVRGSTNPTEGFDLLLQDSLPAAPPSTTYTDAVHGVTFRSYRVEVEP